MSQVIPERFYKTISSLVPTNEQIGYTDDATAVHFVTVRIENARPPPLPLEQPCHVEIYTLPVFCLVCSDRSRSTGRESRVSLAKDSKMRSYHLSWALVVLFSLDSARSLDLPEYLHVCHKDDPKLTECMKQSIETLRPYLARGIPELDIPAIEPINLGDLIVAESVPGQGISITAKDIKAYGPGNFRLKRLNVVEYGKVYSFELELPHLYVEGRYVVDGRILLLPVKGAGKFTGNFTQGVGNVRIKGDRKVINGKNHLSLAKLDIKIKVGDGKIKLENLFGGDRVLGEIINHTINQNFALLSHELIPLIEKALQRIFKLTGNKILERFPEEVLFPE
ncbi:protein takeout [Sabethes cyaneus]|uniref:protein takeout n=1 Tax=Sabethes cyaneus TaxID=53552 RepID=UPI00237EC8AF|nr:protein takeout [Sabethes cyaneus]